jgi:uncharacterized protein (TIGR02246 family)
MKVRQTLFGKRAASVSAVLCLLLGLALGCAKDGQTEQKSEAELRAATRHYAQLVLAMDNVRIAALFTRDGEMSADGQEPVRGQDAIRKFLEGFKAYHVLGESLTADEISVHGPIGEVAGQYHQRVRLPAGKVVEVSGTYTAEWRRDRDGSWRIYRIATTSKP